MFELIENDLVLNRPPPLSAIHLIPAAKQFTGTGFSEVLDKYDNEQIIMHMVSRFNYDTIKGTAVAEVLQKIVTELRANAKKLSPSWRWKTIKLLPYNLVDKEDFLSNCGIKQQDMRNVLTRIYTSIFPFDLLGNINDQVIIDFLVMYLYSEEEERKKLEYPKMSSASSYEEHKFQGSVRSQFVQICRPTHYSMVFYSKKGFNFWRKREMRQFREDYLLEKAEKSWEKILTHLISNTRIVASGSSMRPICPFRKSANWAHSNMLQFMNNALDYYLSVANNKKISDKKLYFIKADVSKCFANMKRDILRELLNTLVAGRTAVVAYVILNAVNGKYFRLFGVGGNEIMAKKNLEKKMARKLHTGSTGKIQYKVFTPSIVDDIMKSIEQLRFTMHGNGGHLYKMTKGVPQGCILSSRLAHVYLLEYDKVVLQPLLTPGSKMFRYADDYLIVLDNKDKALDVVDQLQHPRNPYGLHFRPEKTQLSFNGGNYKKFGNIITWCGAKIDTKKARVLPKFRTTPLTLALNRFKNVNIRAGNTLAEEIIEQRRLWKEYEKLAEKEYRGEDEDVHMCDS